MKKISILTLVCGLTCSVHAQAPEAIVVNNVHIASNTQIIFTNGLSVSSSATQVSCDGHIIIKDIVENEDKISFLSEAHLELRGGASFSVTDDLSFKNLTVQDDATLTVSDGKYLWLTGDVVHNSSEDIVLEASSVTSYAQLKFDNYSGSGEVVQHRYFELGWNLVGSSMQNSTAGIFGSVGTDGGTVNTQNLFSWNGQDYDNVPNNAVPIDDARGYFGFVGVNGIRTSAGVYAFTGTPTTSANLPTLVRGDVSAAARVAMSNNNSTRGGWNLVANPFTCNLDVLSTSRANFNEAFYRFNPTSGNYSTFAPAGTPTSNIVPPLTAFWMQAKGNSSPQFAGGTLTISTHGTVASSSSSSPRTNFDRLVLRSAWDSDTAKQDQTVIAFIDGTTDGFDGDWDAHKMENSGGYPNIYSTHSNGDLLSINAIPYGPGYSDKKTVPISFKATQHGGNYTIRYDDSYMINSYAVYLEDKLEQTFTDLNAQDYGFMNDTNMVNRFVLHFRAGALSIDVPDNLKNSSRLKAWVHGNHAHIYVNDHVSAELKLLSISGKTLQTAYLPLTAGQKAVWPMREDIASGVYLLRITTQYGTETIKFTR